MSHLSYNLCFIITNNTMRKQPVVHSISCMYKKVYVEDSNLIAFESKYNWEIMGLHTFFYPRAPYSLQW